MIKINQKNKKLKQWIEKITKNQEGFTLMEMVLTLSIILLLSVSLGGFSLWKHSGLKERNFNLECEKVMEMILQYQNEAIMDSHRREIYFFNNRMLIKWTKDRTNYQELVPIETFTFSGTFNPSKLLYLYGHGTVSMGGVMNLNGFCGKNRKITFQVGNGRIYLDEKNK